MNKLIHSRHALRGKPSHDDCVILLRIGKTRDGKIAVSNLEKERKPAESDNKSSLQTPITMYTHSFNLEDTTLTSLSIKEPIDLFQQSEHVGWRSIA